MGVSAQATSKSLILADMNADDQGVVYEDKNFKITATNTTNYALQYWDTPGNMDCLVDEGKSTNKSIGLYKSGVVESSIVGSSAYVDIEFLPSESEGFLEGITIYGFSIGKKGAYLRTQMGPNTIKTPNEDFYIEDGLTDTYYTTDGVLDHVIKVEDGESTVCTVVDSYTSVPDEFDYYLDATSEFGTASNMRKLIRKLRIIWTPNKDQSENNPVLVGIKLDFTSEFSVSIDDEIVENLLALTQVGRNIELSENSNVEVYSLSGVLVSKSVSVDNVDLSALSDGVYILKAKSVASTETLTKKVVLN